MKRWARVAFGLGLLIAIQTLSSCASNESVNNSKELKLARSSPHALRLELSVRDETGAWVLYRVERDGSIHWGGAMPAMVGSTTWTDQMTDDERRQLHEMLVMHKWFDVDPKSTNEPKERITRASVSGPEGSNRFTVKGQNVEVEPVESFLESLCRRRLEPELQQLPQPGLQRR